MFQMLCDAVTELLVFQFLVIKRRCRSGSVFPKTVLYLVVVLVKETSLG